MRKGSAIIIFILCIAVLLPLAGCSANLQEPALASKEDALARAKELFPELGQGKDTEFTVESSEDAQEFDGFPKVIQEEIWTVNWSPETGDNGYISMDLAAKDGSLKHLDVHLKGDSEFAVEKLLTREEAEKIAYDFACKYQPQKMALMPSEAEYIEYANDALLNLEYDFEWSRIIEGIPANGNGIGVSVNALTGKVVSFNCQWDDINPVPTRTMSSKKVSEGIIDKVGLYPVYVEYRPEGARFPVARLVYAVNTAYNFFDPFSGNPVSNFGTARTLDHADFYSQNFVPLPAPERIVSWPLTGTRKSPKEIEAIAKGFLKKLGLDGSVHQSGWKREGGPPYCQEWLKFELDHFYDLPWEDVEVSVDTSTGKIEGFSRTPKDERILPPALQLPAEEAQKSALDFLSCLDLSTTGMVLKPDLGTYLWPELQKRTHSFRWVRLVNGIPFHTDYIDVEVSPNSGEVIRFNRSSPLIERFEGTQGIVSFEDATATWRASDPLDLSYVRLGNYFKELPKLTLVYQLNSSRIDAHTGQIIEDDFLPRLAPYKEKTRSHWAEIPLNLLAESGNLPAPEFFDPDKAVTRRECLGLLARAGTEIFEEEETRSPFRDVSINDPDLWTILHAVECRIIEPGGDLRPEELLTREEAATWLAKLIKGEQENAGVPSDQLNMKSLKQELLQKSSAKNDAPGPEEPITWAELSVMIANTVPYLNH